MCGKDFKVPVQVPKLVGSPPHVRERLYGFENGTKFHRITPACAGKTAQEICFSEPFKDHPRMCGKDPVSLLLMQ